MIKKLKLHIWCTKGHGTELLSWFTSPLDDDSIAVEGIQFPQDLTPQGMTKANPMEIQYSRVIPIIKSVVISHRGHMSRESKELKIFIQCKRVTENFQLLRHSCIKKFLQVLSKFV